MPLQSKTTYRVTAAMVNRAGWANSAWPKRGKKRRSVTPHGNYQDTAYTPAGQVGMA